MLLFLLQAPHVPAQNDSVFFSLEAALKRPLRVKYLVIQGPDTLAFRSCMTAFTQMENLYLDGAYVPDKIGELSKLTGLTLAGPVRHLPAGLSGLKKIKSFSLLNAALLRDDPFDISAGWPLLHYLKLVKLPSSGISPSLAKCTSLRTLVLEGIALKKLPEGIGSLKNLESLSLHLDDPADSFVVSLPSLRRIDLHFSCPPDKISSWIGCFSPNELIQELTIEVSGKTSSPETLPAEIFVFRNMKKISLINMNRLIPDSAFRQLSVFPLLEHLQVLNGPDSLTKTICKCGSLTSLEFEGKYFNASVPLCLTHIKTLRISADSITSLLSLQYFPKLDTLFLFSEAGDLTPLLKLQKLRLLYLPDTVPPEIRKQLHRRLPLTKIYYNMSIPVTY